MYYNSLREFIDRLERDGELLRIAEPVSPVLEIAEIADRVSKQPGGGKALLFENVEGSAIPVLINAFGSRKRMSAALGVDDIEDVAREIDGWLKQTPPETLFDKIKLLPRLLEASRFPPKLSGAPAPCQEVVHTGDAVDLGMLPILQCWPGDAGRFITFPMVINRSLDRRLRNVGLYRMQVFDKNTTGMHWHIHKDGAHFFHEYRKRGQRMETAVAIGGDPASCYAASAPLPYGIDEFLLAGFLRKAPVPLVKCKTVDLEVPATAEIVLEGYIDPGELRREGPFGDHTGYYSQDGDYPVFHVTAITHRQNPVYLTTIVGKPPQEDFYLGQATERIFLPLLRAQLPELTDMYMPPEGVFHNCVIAAIDKRFPLQARRLMSAFWGAGQMSFVKTIVAVDAEVNVRDMEKVTRAVLDGINCKHDLFFAAGVLDALNHGSDLPLSGSKLGIDATAKIHGEPGFGETVQPSGPLPPDIPGKVNQKFPTVKSCRLFGSERKRPVLFTACAKSRPGETAEFIMNFLQDPEFAGIGAIVVLEPHVDTNDLALAMWKLLGNLDPKRDIHAVDGRLGIDASRKLPAEGYKQDWPDEIEMSATVKSRVDNKWGKMFQ